MLSHRFAFVVLCITVISGATVLHPTSSKECVGLGGVATNNCVETGNDNLVLEGSQTTNSRSQSEHGSENRDNRRVMDGTYRDTRNAAPITDHAPPDAPQDYGTRPAVDCESPSTPCSLIPTTPTPSPTTSPTARTIPAVTLTDLAVFRPATPSLTSEPDRAGIAGLPVNLVATAHAQTLHGTLFELPVAVRFTPHHYTFTHGDGTAASTRTGGTSWKITGDPQFTPSATSHTYAQRGTYSATVTVSYSPAVDFGDGVWRPVAGYVAATSTPQSIRIYEAHTALVAHTCIEDPRGPGC